MMGGDAACRNPPHRVCTVFAPSSPAPSVAGRNVRAVACWPDADLLMRMPLQDAAVRPPLQSISRPISRRGSRRRSAAPAAADWLVCRRRTPSQARRGRRRAHNVRGAFACAAVAASRAGARADRHVLTTGATAEECARVGRRASAVSVGRWCGKGRPRRARNALDGRRGVFRCASRAHQDEDLFEMPSRKSLIARSAAGASRRTQTSSATLA